jgi:hypothetical protein
MEPVLTFQNLETMQLVGRIKAEWDNTPEAKRPSDILVDSIGLGAGVAARLQELNLPARGINVAESPAMREQYVNLKAELWFGHARQWFEARDSNLANDITLGDELCAVNFEPPTSSGKIKIEPKQATRKRLGSSPDLADAFVFCDCSPESPVGRRSLCYDRKALDGRKENKPAGCVIEMAASLGIALLTEQEYRNLQRLGEFDRKTPSQRLRDVLYVYWKQVESARAFDDFYLAQMNTIIEGFKEKLEPR